MECCSKVDVPSWNIPRANVLLMEYIPLVDIHYWNIGGCSSVREDFLTLSSQKNAKSKEKLISVAHTSLISITYTRSSCCSREEISQLDISKCMDSNSYSNFSYLIAQLLIFRPWKRKLPNQKNCSPDSARRKTCIGT